MKTKILCAAAAAAVLAVVSVSCSSGNGGDESVPASAAIPAATATSPAATATAAATAATAASSAPASEAAAPEPVSLSIPFTARNGTGAITISGEDSPIVEWFASQPGEITLDLLDADIEDAGSVVGELVSFWFFRDQGSGEVPPSFAVPDNGAITDSIGTSYVVESQPLPPAPGTETTTTTSTTTTATTTTTTTSSAPETTEPPTSTTSTTSTTTTTTTSSVPTVTVPEPEPPSSLQVQVLNGSGVAGAAGRMTAKLSQAGYVVLPAGNAPGRYSSSAVYYAEGWQADAEEILQAADIDEIEQTAPMPEQFRSEQAAVIVLLGTDTAPAVAAEQTTLRPEPDFGTRLPLGDDVPRDRYVPGLANIQIFTQENDADPETFNYIHSLQQWLRYVANFREDNLIDDLPEDRGTYRDLLAVYDSIEEVFDWLGFTPQNVCGAPPGYSFTDLIQPTREFSEETQNHRGDAIFTTDRLLELHGGERINPENNLEFYIREAVQTAYDNWRIAELLDETETPQTIMCYAWKTAAGDIPEFANGVWYMLLTPGFQPRENLMSQGTYHVKEISRNGNIVHLIVCHPAERERHVLLHWREAGYRAEVLGYSEHMGCQGTFDGETSISEDSNGAEDTISFSFGERVFSAADMLEFPRE